jgi:sugar/nucleoside kinase (ribokinase family)
MRLEAARALRAGYRGPIYADLHSLFLGLGWEGRRLPRALPEWGDWLRCFDAVQMNEDEFELLGQAWSDPWHLAAEAVGPDLKLITVTLGARGAAYVATGDFDADPLRWRHSEALARVSTARSGHVAVEGGQRTGDPTGCGDVWGATFFARLLAGDPLDAALREANRLASRNVEHRGARGLFRHLSGRLSHMEEHV